LLWCICAIKLRTSSPKLSWTVMSQCQSPEDTNYRRLIFLQYLLHESTVHLHPFTYFQQTRQLPINWQPQYRNIIVVTCVVISYAPEISDQTSQFLRSEFMSSTTRVVSEFLELSTIKPSFLASRLLICGLLYSSSVARLSFVCCERSYRSYNWTSCISTSDTNKYRISLLVLRNHSSSPTRWHLLTLLLPLSISVRRKYAQSWALFASSCFDLTRVIHILDGQNKPRYPLGPARYLKSLPIATNLCLTALSKIPCHHIITKLQQRKTNYNSGLSVAGLGFGDIHLAFQHIISSFFCVTPIIPLSIAARIYPFLSYVYCCENLTTRLNLTTLSLKDMSLVVRAIKTLNSQVL
jgi:hypothetical protein